MNGMLHHHEYYRDAVERRQREAHRAAQANALGRLSSRARRRYRQHPVRSRILAVASPMAVVLAILAVLI